MESNTNNISSAGLHGLDQRQRRSETSEEVDIRQGQNTLGSLSLSTGLTPSHNRAARLWLVATIIITSMALGAHVPPTKVFRRLSE